MTSPMTWFRRHFGWKPLSRSLAPRLALLSYFVAAFGFPLPTSSTKDYSQPFPRQHRLCGCGHAVDCLGCCCCGNHEAPQAQPRESFAEAQLSVAEQMPAQVSDDPPTSKACCHHRANAAVSSQPKPAPQANHAPQKASTSFRWVAGISAFKCQGLSALWVSAIPTLPTLAEPSWYLDLAPSGWVACADAFPMTLGRRPLVPPPRSVVAS